MRFKRTLAVAAAAVGSLAAVGLPATSAHAAGTVTSVALPIANYSHMVLDPAQQLIFISDKTDSTILVTDYSGKTVATITGESGVDGLALSSDDSTVYAALSTGDAVVAISTSTLTQTASYSTGTAGTDPTYVAYASGKVWFGYSGTAAGQGGIGSIDPSTSPATVTLDVNGSGYWYAAPMLAASPSGELVAAEPGMSPTSLASYDVSSGTATLLAQSTFVAPPDATIEVDNVESLQLTPDGKDVVIAAGYPYEQVVFQVSDLSVVGQYPTNSYPDAVSVSGNGTVAAGTTDSVVTSSGGISAAVDELFLFAPGGSAPLDTYTFSSGSLADDGVAFTPDGSKLFVITSPVYPAVDAALNVINDPVQGSSTLSVSTPATERKPTSITLTGTLGGTSPYAGGQTLTVTRTDPADPNGVALPDVTTNADGTFTITDNNMPKVLGNTESITYEVSYAGDPYLTASTASATVSVINS